MLSTINTIRVFGILGAAAIILYPFINVAETFACSGGGSIGTCGG